jgi:molybdate transport system substrate-binding protein
MAAPLVASMVVALAASVGCAPPGRAEGGAPGEGRQPGRILVATTVSLLEPLTALARAYEARTGERVTITPGPSNALARQIAAGAPIDLFISADEHQMAVVERAGLVVPGTRLELVGNRLAIVVPADSRKRIDAPRDLAGPAIRRLAIGDPAAVPAGVYARAYLEGAGVWSALQPKSIPVSTVRAALAAVESGEADAGVVYRTDARVGRVRIAFEVPPADGPRIVYPAAVVTVGRNAAGARRLLAYLAGPEARAVFEAAGFDRPSAVAPAAPGARSVGQGGPDTPRGVP